MLYNTSPDTLFIPQSTNIDPTGFGKVAIVTGCSSGIGLAVAQLLLAHQFQVCGLDVADFDYHLLREADHGRFHFHKGDLSSPGVCEEGVRICVAGFGYVFPLSSSVARRIQSQGDANQVDITRKASSRRPSKRSRRNG